MNIAPLNEKGEIIDWWFAYKVPELHEKDKNGNPVVATGYEYVYYGANDSQVVLSPHLLTGEEGAIKRTVNSILSCKDETTGYILYNDEMPKSVLDQGRKDSVSLGHTKGLIAFDTASQTALWLLHSWPKFVDPLSAQMPAPNYGQTFICIALTLDTANVIAEQMINHQEPQTYLNQIPASLGQGSALYRLSEKLDPKAKGDSDVIECVSRAGLPFKVIAKNKKWNDDFWNDLVGDVLKDNMYVETWIRGKVASSQDSDGKDEVSDIKKVDLNPVAPYSWSETEDHAKWGITQNKNYVCVGDINRMISQRKRGGGTIAFENQILWSFLKGIES